MRILAAALLVSFSCCTAFADPITEAINRAEDTGAEQIKIVHLQHAPAADAARTLQQVFHEEGLIVTPHLVNNQIILSRGDARTIDRAIAMLEQLDRPTALYKFECVVLTLSGAPAGGAAKPESSIAGLPEGTLLSAEEISAISNGKLDELLASLKKDGRLQNVLRPHIITAEGNPGRIQLGAQKAVRTGSTTSRTGGRISSFNYQNVGTLIEINARNEGGDTVIAEVNFEDSHVLPAEEGEDSPPAEVGTTTIQSTVRGRHGHYVAMAGAIEQNAADKPHQMLLLIRPTVVTP